MIKRHKIYKVIISGIALFTFIYWGLNPEFICKMASNTPQTCGYSSQGVMTNVFGSVSGIMLTALAVAILTTWIRKD